MCVGFSLVVLEVVCCHTVEMVRPGNLILPDSDPSLPQLVLEEAEVLPCTERIVLILVVFYGFRLLSICDASVAVVFGIDDSLSCHVGRASVGGIHCHFFLTGTRDGPSPSFSASFGCSCTLVL